MEIKVTVADESHIKYAEDICKEIYISSLERKTGIANRTPEYICEKIRAGKAVIALAIPDKAATAPDEASTSQDEASTSQDEAGSKQEGKDKTEQENGSAQPDEKFAGFSYIESWGGKSFVANSGLIVAHEFRGLGVAKKIKEQTFILSRHLFPDAKIFSITTGAAVMKMNYEFGFRPVPYTELTDDPEFWKGCEGCRHFDILKSHDYKMCICTGLLYDPKEHLEIHHPDE